MRPDDDESRAPVFGSWRAWYVVVLGTLVAFVAFTVWLTVHFQ